MNNLLFENGTKFLFGGGCVKEYLASFLRKYGPSVLLVTEEGERRCTDGASARGSCRKVPASWQQRQLRAVPPWKARL